MGFQKLILSLLACSVLCNATTLPVFASDARPVDIQVFSATSNYSEGDTIQFDVSVTNHNQYTVDPLTITALLPSEYSISENAEYAVQLAANETKQYSIRRND